MKKQVILFIFCLLGMCVLSGCSSENKDDKIEIKVQYQCGRMSLNLESVLEEKFSNIDIVTDELVGDPIYIISKEIEHNLEPDIYLYEGLKSLDEDMVSDVFYNLADQKFANNYYLSSVSECVNKDGGLYYLPGPVYVYGIVYDKTAFEDLNLEVPHSYSEFVRLLNKVRDMNLVGYEPDIVDPNIEHEVKVEPFVPTLKWSDMWSIIFNSYMYDEYLKGSSNAIWLDEYQKGNESMVGHMEGAAEKLLKLFEDGILSTDYWNVRAPVRTSKLFRFHTSLMTVECQSAIGYDFAEDDEDAHEIGMFPFYSGDDEDSSYLYSIPRCYFGMTKKAAMDKERKEAILKIFDYFSTEEGQNLLIEGGGGDINLLKDSKLSNHPFYDEIRETYQEKRVISSFNYAGKYSNVEHYLHSTTPSLVNGDITINEWLTGADMARDEALNAKDSVLEEYGTCSKTLSVEETAVVVGESYILQTGADIAIVPCQSNFGMKNRLFKGTITDSSINIITTTRISTSENYEDANYIYLATVRITGQQLIDYLNSMGDVFIGLAGLEVIYDSKKDIGKRYVSIKYNGEEIKPTDTFKAASILGAVKDFSIIDIYDDVLFKDMFINYLNSVNGEIEAPKSLTIR